MLVALIVVCYLLLNSWVTLLIMGMAGTAGQLDKNIITPAVLMVLFAPIMLFLIYLMYISQKIRRSKR